MRGRAGAQRLAVTSGGTIPDRGLYGVFLPDGTRVGELDEEMVYESRVGETFLLGRQHLAHRGHHPRAGRGHARPRASRARCRSGTATGPAARSSWAGRWARSCARCGPRVQRLARAAPARPRARSRWPPRNLVAYLDEQAEACGGAGARRPHHRGRAVPRRDRRLAGVRAEPVRRAGPRPVGHGPAGPAGRALGHRRRAHVERRRHRAAPARGGRRPPPRRAGHRPRRDRRDRGGPAPPDGACSRSRFRECAARALLLPRRRPDRRTPLWQQRQKAADLLAVAANHPDFPILLEATRECINDVFDLPALREVLTDLRSRRVRMVAVETPRASPFAQSLLFGWIGVYMYEGDAPLAERRAAALALDRDLLRDLLGAEELRELIDPVVLADLELELQRLVDGRRARDADEVHDLLRVLGPLSLWEIDVARAWPAERSAQAWVDQLVAERRAIRVVDRRRRAPGRGRGRRPGCATRSAWPCRPGCPPRSPTRCPSRWSTWWPASPAPTARSWPRRSPSATGSASTGWSRPSIGSRQQGRIVRGEFRPDGIEREWCDDDVLRQLRRRSLAALRKEVEPVDGAALARFLPEWQGVGRARRGLDALVEAIGLAAGRGPAGLGARGRRARRPGGRLPARRPRRAVHLGRGGVGRRRAARLQRRAGPPAVPRPGRPAGATRPRRRRPPRSSTSPLHEAIRVAPGHRSGALVLARAGAGGGRRPASPTTTPRCSTALWDLVWAGEVTNDSLAPLRAMAGRRAGRRPAGRPGRPPAARCGCDPSWGGPAWAAAARGRGGGSGSGRPPAARVAGRWWPRCCCRAPTPDRGGPRPGAAAARAPRRAHPRGGAGRGRRGRVRRGLPGAQGARGAGPGPARLLRGGPGRRPVRPARRGRSAAGRARPRSRAAPDRVGPLVLGATDPAQPYGAALAWPESAGRPARSAGAFVVSVAGRARGRCSNGGPAACRPSPAPPTTRTGPRA